VNWPNRSAMRHGLWRDRAEEYERLLNAAARCD